MVVCRGRCLRIFSKLGRISGPSGKDSTSGPSNDGRFEYLEWGHRLNDSRHSSCIGSDKGSGPPRLPSQAGGPLSLYVSNVVGLF